MSAGTAEGDIFTAGSELSFFDIPDIAGGREEDGKGEKGVEGVECGGWRVALGCCFDLRFATHAAMLAQDGLGADIVM